MMSNPRLLKKLTSLSSRRLDNQILYRLLRAAGLMFLIFIAGTFGYYYLCEERYSLLLCAYMTVVTLTSIGYGEVIPVQGQTDMMIFTIGLIISGMGVMLYFVSTLTAFVVDGDLRDLLHGRRMKRQIEKLHDHFIIAGMGSMGRYVLDELQISKRQCIVIERYEEKTQELIDLGVPYIVGDATDEEILIEAGIRRAQGIIIALGNERDNLFATITVKELNPKLRVVTRGDDPRSEKKFLRAGATSVIYTNVLGGLRMAAEVIRPEVTSFLDLMMRDHGSFRRIEELPIPSTSPLVGTPLKKTAFRKHTDALIIAVHDMDTDDYHFNPGPEHVLAASTKLIMLTLVDDVAKLEAIIRGELR